ncbi:MULTISPECIES: DUF3969 family protein [Xenorhabdus]|uniref:DUF3969 family protein n=2 Tax=Xenorhabdus TaxID=626 RepID=A0ABT5LVT7_9GAMM|nr:MULTISPECIES: DUF3969 family protein [Xenorhabdus]MDC9590371.1 DUF3969 family protein [Xenorhabdus yunnanensis]MDC9598539.1 DUF3969 family protein [Xenorhabdus anantnagensis]
MDFNYRIQDKHAGKFVSFVILGVLYSLDKELISIEEAEGFIFMPYIAKLLKKTKVSDALSDVDALVEIIETGCQLEDIESIRPAFLSESINALIEETLSVIKNSKEVGRLVNKEVNVLNRK